MKNCSRKDCEQKNPQPLENFGRRMSGAKPKSECKKCCARYMSLRYKADPITARKRTQEWTKNNPGKRKPYSKFKKNQCEACSFVALDPCQLDVDHIDGIKTNNHPSNLQTLCANCHRLKTKLNKDNQTYAIKLRLVANGSA